METSQKDQVVKFPEPDNLDLALQQQQLLDLVQEIKDFEGNMRNVVKNLLTLLGNNRIDPNDSESLLELIKKEKPIFDAEAMYSLDRSSGINLISAACYIFLYPDELSHSGMTKKQKGLFKTLFDIIKKNSNEIKDQIAQMIPAGSENRNYSIVALSLIDKKNENLKKSALKILKQWQKSNNEEMKRFQRILSFYTACHVSDLDINVLNTYFNYYGATFLIHLHKTAFFYKFFSQNPEKKKLLMILEKFFKNSTHSLYYPVLQAEFTSLVQKLGSSIPPEIAIPVFLDHQVPLNNVLQLDPARN